MAASALHRRPTPVCYRFPQSALACEVKIPITHLTNLRFDLPNYYARRVRNAFAELDARFDLFDLEGELDSLLRVHLLV